MKNTVIELNIGSGTHTNLHALAYGPSFLNNTTNSFSEPTFENVVIVAPSGQKIYNNGGTSATGVSVYTSIEGMYEDYDFSGWDSSIWEISKDASQNVTGVGLKNPQ